jgi:DMSO/TMAO reductase YedYZ molybdopterin-dependent catalytic subunit
VKSSTKRIGLPLSTVGYGVATGLITAAVALGAGQLLAGFTGPQGSPVATVGGAAIDLTPPPVKNFAISAFGSNDKKMLVAGILVVIALYAAAAGVAAMRRLAYGYAALVLFAILGLAAALTRPVDRSSGVLPVLVGAAVGALTMFLLVRAAGGLAAQAAARAGNSAAAAGPQAEPAGRSRPGQRESPPPVPEQAVSEQAQPGEAQPGEAQPGEAQPGEAQPGQEPQEAEPGASWIPVTPAAAGPAAAQPAGRAPGRPPATTQPGGRREFLVTSAVAVVGAGASALAGRGLAERTSVSQARADLHIPTPVTTPAALPPGTELPIRGLTSFITPNGSFYRVDTALILPQVSPSSWALHIHGMVERELTISFHELLKMPLIEEYVTLACVSNPVGGSYVGNALWLGASLARVLRMAGIKRGADQLLCSSVDGFTSGTPVQTVMDGRNAMLAVAMNGTALPVAHGFPARMVVPGLYGYVSATKWLADIKVTTYASEIAYWAQRGWSARAPIKTESRIDVPAFGKSVQAGRTPVAGVAWAQHKGIDAVEVRADHGPWQHAKLAAVPGIDTWRQWVWEWDAVKGTHLIEARATDATGYTQTAVQAPPEPNGASGYPSLTVTVT